MSFTSISARIAPRLERPYQRESRRRYGFHAFGLACRMAGRIPQPAKTSGRCFPRLTISLFREAI